VDTLIAAGLSPAEAARVLGVTPHRVRQMLDSGQLGYQRTALGRLSNPGDVERLRRERADRQKGNPRPSRGRKGKG
jgi:excisionase family DNA binding protein